MGFGLVRRIRGWLGFCLFLWGFLYSVVCLPCSVFRVEIRLGWGLWFFWILGLEVTSKGRFGFLENYIGICHIQFTCTLLCLLMYVYCLPHMYDVNVPCTCAGVMEIGVRGSMGCCLFFAVSLHLEFGIILILYWYCYHGTEYGVLSA